MRRNFWLSIVISLLFIMGAEFSLAASVPKKAIRVYDANNQFLGILAAKVGMNVTILVPSISRFVQLAVQNGDMYNDATSLDFSESDCTGTTYNVEPWRQYDVFRFRGRYLTGEDAGPAYLSMYSFMKNDGPCIPIDSDHLKLVIPVKETTLPFDLPVALPLRFEYK